MTRKTKEMMDATDKRNRADLWHGETVKGFMEDDQAVYPPGPIPIRKYPVQGRKP